MKQLWTKMILLLAALLVFTTLSAIGAASGEIKAFVSILPQAYFVERIGGPFVDVEVLVGPGQSPATYEPTPKQMAKLGRAQVYFRIGTPFERGFIDTIARTFRNLIIIDTRKGVTLNYFQEDEENQIPDPHIWLDPKRVKIQANTICEALSKIDAAHASEFKENLHSFQADLDRVDAQIAETLAPVKGQKFYVFHPAFGYFGESYGLTQVAVEIAGKEPSAKQLADLIERAKREKVRVIFVQPQYAKKDAETIAKAIGGAVIPINPLPRDYLTSLEEMAQILKDGLSQR